MKIQTLLNEIWSKGHLTQDQLIRTIEHTLKGRGSVTKVDRKGNRDGIEAQVTMTYASFIDMFSGVDRGIDRVIELSKSTDTHNTSDYMGKSKANDLLRKLYDRARSNVRSIIPRGWIIGSLDTGLPYVEDLQHTFTFPIKRDYGKQAENVGIYYHYTLASNVESIQRHGLLPKSGKRLAYDGYRDRIFLVSAKGGHDHEFAHSLVTGPGSRDSNPDIAVFEVSIPSEIKTYKDPQSSGIFTEQPIPPDHLKLIYTGKVSGMPQ